VDRYKQIRDLVESFEKDFAKFYKKGSKAAGIRLRKDMQILRTFAKEIRNEVQQINTEKENPPEQ
jgi:hypothetical protein